jgi:hypothetical protein
MEMEMKRRQDQEHSGTIKRATKYEDDQEEQQAERTAVEKGAKCLCTDRARLAAKAA